MGAPVWFSSLNFARLPSGLAPSGASHGSVFPLVAVARLAMTADVSVTNKTGAKVGWAVCVGVSVGGMGVDVGIAACVSEIIVNAAEMAVFCMLAISIVWVAGALQALTDIAIARNRGSM